MEDELEALVAAEQKAVSEKKSLSKRDTCWLVFSACVIGWGVTLLFLASFPRRASVVAVVDVLDHRTAAWYRQDRPVQRLGHDNRYVEINRDKSKVAQRIQDMADLDQVRFGTCGRFEAFLAGDTTTQWQKNPAVSEKLKAEHCRDGAAYRLHDCCGLEIERFICETVHPTRKDVTVTIERFGKFVGRGGYDWTTVSGLDDVGGLMKERMEGKSIAFFGGMAAPIYPNGTLVGYPPLHIHHAHVLPYANSTERADKICGSMGDHHDLIHQSHGDTACLEEEGGLACLLQLTDLGMARVVENSTTGLGANFDVNDVRPLASEEMDYWFEIVVLHSPYDRERMQRCTQVGLNNHCVGKGPCTYAIPYDPNTNLFAYKYIHGDYDSELSTGYMSNFVLHAHQTIMDSAFLFISPDDSVFEPIDSFRRGRDYPLMFECLQEGGKQLFDMESAKQELFRRISDAGGTLVCEATRPSLHIKADGYETQVYDRRPRLNCQSGRVPLQVGDVLTVVAFNEVRPHNVTRSTACELRRNNPFDKVFAVHQHSIFRFDLSHDVGHEPEYVPPSYFFYADRGKLKVNRRQRLDELLNTGCPADLIKYAY